MEIWAVTEAEARHAVDRLWIVRQASHGGQPEIDADLGADPVVAQVRGEAEFEVRVGGVQTLVLKTIRLELVEQSGSPAFLGQLKEPSASFGFDHGQRHIRAARHSRIQGNGTYRRSCTRSGPARVRRRLWHPRPRTGRIDQAGVPGRGSAPGKPGAVQRARMGTDWVIRKAVLGSSTEQLASAVLSVGGDGSD